MPKFKKSDLLKILSKETSAKKHAILLVDDEPRVLNSLMDMLGTDYDILTAQSGAQALALLDNHPQRERIHLLICDQRMPGMSGIEFLTASIELLPYAKRIILTGFAEMDVVVAAINKAQIYKFLSKPCGAAELQLTVKRAIESYEQEEQNRQLLQQYKQLNRKLEELNRDLEEKVEERTRELAEKAEQLQALNSAKDCFLSILAHDLMSPFNALALAIQALSKQHNEMSQAEREAFLLQINERAKSLFLLLENLLNWSSVQWGALQPRPRRYQLSDLLDAVISELSAPVQSKQIELQLDYEPDAAIVVDKKMFQIIIRNLLSNAIKFTPAHGLISISIQLDAQSLHCCISDNGQGIQPEEQAVLFRFGRSGSRKGTAGETGSGIGLHLCKALLEAHGGQIWFESQWQKGSRFFFSIPQTSPDNISQNHRQGDSEMGYPSIEQLVPHRDTMLRIDRLLDWTPDRIKGSFQIRAEDPFVRDGFLCEEGLVETMAQTVAAGQSLPEVQAGSSPSLGYLTGIEQLSFSRRVRIGESLETQAVLISATGPLRIMRCVAHCNGEEVAHGVLKFYLDKSSQAV